MSRTYDGLNFRVVSLYSMWILYVCDPYTLSDRSDTSDTSDTSDWADSILLYDPSDDDHYYLTIFFHLTFLPTLFQYNCHLTADLFTLEQQRSLGGVWLKGFLHEIVSLPILSLTIYSQNQSCRRSSPVNISEKPVSIAAPALCWHCDCFSRQKQMAS